MKITRNQLENQQIWIYAIALLIGGAVGLLSPGAGRVWMRRSHR